MEGSDIKDDEDISATMMRRARCLRVARYSMNTSSNIKMLSEDIPSSESSSDAFLLIRLWSWIDRVESFCFDGEEIEDMRDLPRAIARLSPETETTLDVLRKGERIAVTVELGLRNADDA